MSAVHDGRCSPWVMCSCSVVRGNQIRDNNQERNIILVIVVKFFSVFHWHLSVVNTKPEDFCESQDDSLIAKFRTDIWDIAGTIFLQDGPFFVVRLAVMISFSEFHQMLVFFTIKNVLVVLINIYRLWVIWIDNKP